MPPEQPHRRCDAWMLPALVGILGCLVPARGQVPEIRFGADTSSGDETITPVAIEAILTQTSTQPVSVAYSVVGGSARRGAISGPGVDCWVDSGTLLWGPGETSQSFFVDVFDDSLVESNETVIIRLDSPQNATLGVPAGHTYTILDNDASVTPPVPGATSFFEFAVAQGSVRESATNAYIEVTLTPAAATSATVAYEVGEPLRGTKATGGGVDFTLDEGILSFDAGETYQELVVPIVDDARAESNEVIAIYLSDPVGARMGLGFRHLQTIIDDDEVEVEFVSTTSSNLESATAVSFDLRVVGETDHDVSAAFSVEGTARGDGIDFTRAPGVVRFPAGQTNLSLTATVESDDDVEDDEYFALTLITVTNAVIGTNFAHVYTIVDDDVEKPRVGFEVKRSLGEETAPSMEIAVVLDTAAPTNLVVEFAVSGNASPTADYLAASPLQLDISPGQTESNLVIAIVDDVLDEPDEQLILRITNVVNGVINSNHTHTHWIVDNDRPPEAIDFFRQEIASRVTNQVLTVIGPKAPSIRPRGLAVDDAGNFYVTDEGPAGGPGEGSVWMIPSGQRRALRIASGLTRPGDIELSPDQRAFVVAAPDGTVTRKGFGISIRLRDVAPGGRPQVYIKTARGTRQARISADGYFHFLDVLIPAQTDQTIEVVVEADGRARPAYQVPLGQPGSGIAFGHTVVELSP